MKLSLGYITVPTKKAAKEIVLELFERKLIACANVVPNVESYFMWEGELTKEKELIILFKTRAKNEDKIIKYVREIHPYECPCIIFKSIDYGNPEFLEWVNASC